MSRPVDPLERAERILADLRTATREAAGVLKDLRRAMREAHEQVEGYYVTRVKADLDAHTRTWQAGVDQWWADAKADLTRTVDDAIAKAEPIIINASRLEMLCEAVAREVAAHTVYTEDGPHVDYSVENRPPGFEPA